MWVFLRCWGHEFTNSHSLGVSLQHLAKFEKSAPTLHPLGGLHRAPGEATARLGIVHQHQRVIGRIQNNHMLAHRIALGVPEGGIDFAFGDAFPHDADMDQLGGVAFDKGCYVGQEVVSRIEHRHTARRRIIIVTSASAAALPASGEILADGRPLGALGSTVRGPGLALVRLDRARDAIERGETITVAGTPVSLSIPSWARFGWPTVAAEAREG